MLIEINRRPRGKRGREINERSEGRGKMRKMERKRGGQSESERGVRRGRKRGKEKSEV